MRANVGSPDDGCLVRINQICPSCTTPIETEADRMQSMMPHGGNVHEVQVWWSCPTCDTAYYHDYTADALAYHTVPDLAEPWVGEVDGGETCISIFDQEFDWGDVPRLPEM